MKYAIRSRESTGQPVGLPAQQRSVRQYTNLAIFEVKGRHGQWLKVSRNMASAYLAAGLDLEEIGHMSELGE